MTNRPLYVVAPDIPPSAEYWLGTTSRGQDVFWQLAASMRNTLLFGIVVALISRVIAVAVGLMSGYVGGRVDQAIMAINDTLNALPNIPIRLLLVFVAARPDYLVAARLHRGDARLAAR